MMSEDSPKTSVLSSPQRRCHIILMLCLPDPVVTLESVCQHNQVDRTIARQDIAEVALEIQRYHRLAVAEDEQENLKICGSPLDQRLCLLHVLRRALRLSPEFVLAFGASLRQRLQTLPLDRALYDGSNLNALIAHCERRLMRSFSPRDRQLVQLCLWHAFIYPCAADFNLHQQRWLSDKVEYRLARDIVRCWQKKGYQPAGAETPALLALLFSQLHIPHAEQLHGEQEQLLWQAVEQLIAHFERLSDMQFSNRQGLSAQLYPHLAQALERNLFAIGIDGGLVEDVARQYPRLLRTTAAALAAFEQQYLVQFPDEELGLIAIIFGAWLVQDNALQEKQVLLLTGIDSDLERRLEQQLRELTLLPLNIKYLNVADFQRHSAPKGVALVVTPYATSLPLYSPPLIHAEMPLGEHQQHSIRMLLES